MKVGKIEGINFNFVYFSFLEDLFEKVNLEEFVLGVYVIGRRILFLI